MRKPICVVCGLTATVDGLCDDHYSERYELFDVEPMVVQVCDGCEAVYDQAWLKEPLEEILKNGIKRQLKSHGDITSINVALKLIGYNYVATITATGTIPPAKIVKTTEKKIGIRIKAIKCPNCVKLSGNYHEAVIQVRGKRMDYLMSLINVISTDVPKRSERIKEGWNIYFVHKAAARAVIGSLKIDFRRAREAEPEVIRSHKIAGTKDGRPLMRDFYALR